MATISQGTTVSFGATAIGSVLNASGSPGSASTSDTTTIEALIRGTGAEARVVKRRDCTAIEPGKVSVRLLGMPPFAPADIGSVDTVTFSTPGGSLSGDAILEAYEVDAAVGDLLRGSVTFAFTGT